MKNNHTHKKSSIQTTPVLDTYNRPMNDLRISLTDRCNFNCTYCMPDKNMEFLPREALLSFEEIEYFVRIVTRLGIQKIKLTGGEPMLRVGMDVLIKNLLHIPGIKDIGLITNGVFLKSIGHRLKNAGLHRISISLDALDERIFQNIVGNVHSIHPVLEGIEVAYALGFNPIKINCVIQRGINDKQIMPLVNYFKKPHFHLRFIEFMDVGNIAWNQNQVVSSQEILAIIQEKYELQAIKSAYYGEVANRFRHVDGDGEIGFISSVSNPFCEDCTRLRLSSDGKLYGCLFTDKYVDIKSIIRESKDDEQLYETVRSFWTQRDDRYSEERKDLHSTQQRKNMNFMGG